MSKKKQRNVKMYLRLVFFFGFLALLCIFLAQEQANIEKKNVLPSQKHFLSYMHGVATTSPQKDPAAQQTVVPSPAVTLIPAKTEDVAAANDYCARAPVLMYHHIQPESMAKQKGQTSLTVDNDIFDRQMAYLSSHGYTEITAEQLVNALITRSPLPPKSVVVTLDDGYKDVYTYAYPIFQKYHILANLMIPTGLLEGADYLSWSQLQDMQKSGLVYVTDHTWSHFSLPNGNAGKITFEVSTAKQQLEQHLSQTVDIFTYPYGAFNTLAIQILQKLGFKGAYSTIGGSYQCQSFIMALHRTRIGNSSLSYYGL